MVAQALFLLNDPGARDALLRQLAQERNPEVRAAMAEALVPLRDPAVVPALLGLLRDPSLEVAEVAARGLADEKNIAQLIRADAALAKQVRDELLLAFETRTGAPGTGALRVALIDAMAALKDPQLAERIYVPLLRPNESVAVRAAALRALGKLQQPWVAGLILQAGSVRDQDDQVRMEALNALAMTATFADADSIYGVVRDEKEKPPLREKAWQVLRTLFADAPDEQLTRWADRFRDEPDRRIEILKVLAKRLGAQGNKARLAETQQNIGASLMDLSAQSSNGAEKIALADEADKYFEPALAYYRERKPNDQDMQTSALLDNRMDALLTSKQYIKAAGFAESSIKLNAANQEGMGRKLRNEVDRLRNEKQYNDAAKLIEALYKMTPSLDDRYRNGIKAIEVEVRANLPKPQSALGSGIDSGIPIFDFGNPEEFDLLGNVIHKPNGHRGVRLQRVIPGVGPPQRGGVFKGRC
jgi:HEAT repeat protein